MVDWFSVAAALIVKQTRRDYFTNLLFFRSPVTVKEKQPNPPVARADEGRKGRSPERRGRHRDSPEKTEGREVRMKDTVIL